ncbi:hypothetical protein [Acetobacter orientalis]|uniref:Uncharacterized protein n=1 Tax=Acetobacter orientalis TaxID=146474 RepID=A0A251ZWH4_9PROT|nr:hypothetical protein [Acetobacter orientalis]OUI79016.1 hypothetical protein HK12_01370 [Acetobacter orientalis]
MKKIDVIKNTIDNLSRAGVPALSGASSIITNIRNMVLSTDMAEELDKGLEDPKENETEEEYVQRMSDKLTGKLTDYVKSKALVKR